MELELELESSLFGAYEEKAMVFVLRLGFLVGILLRI